jgi:hypothetical protein
MHFMHGCLPHVNADLCPFSQEKMEIWTPLALRLHLLPRIHGSWRAAFIWVERRNEWSKSFKPRFEESQVIELHGPSQWAESSLLMPQRQAKWV